MEAHRYYLLAQPVGRNQLLPANFSHTIRVERTPADATILTHCGRSAEAVRARAQAGAVCFVAYQNDEASGFLWLHPGPHEEHTHPCVLQPTPPGQAWLDLDIVILPHARHSLTFAALWDAANTYLREQNASWCQSRISAFNTHSLRAHQRLGARVIGSLTFLQFGRWHVVFGGAAPGIHLSTPDRGKPVVRLRAPCDT
ncbi:hypothetical protein LRF89_10580 [Halorhodospira sp. 9621]|uniref:GNAT family N-acetyltransferase n=1 Tax=Halorhodospira sp. 9621 TaxID=2899135 RepID=UPI001EE8E3B1|nr:hypothetical protein [Halorhodospira sp. 9621]MCG5533881.1 hypothetical protein [Halorhodospira sp. 9621]